MYKVFVTNFQGEEEMVYECDNIADLDNGYSDRLAQMGFYFRVDHWHFDLNEEYA